MECLKNIISTDAIVKMINIPLTFPKQFNNNKSHLYPSKNNTHILLEYFQKFLELL